MSEIQKQNQHIILASGSPRRHALLKAMGYDFQVIVPDVDENVQGPAKEVVAILADRKASAVAAGLIEGLVIASDTLVAYDGQALGKPVDAGDARRMLHMLSGRTHEVFTGVCMIDAASGKRLCRVVRTGVTFRPLTDDEIDAYISTSEPMDKAGAYAIQGGAHGFVEAFDGSYENVIGFPVDDIRDMLSDFER